MEDLDPDLIVCNLKEVFAVQQRHFEFSQGNYNQTELQLLVYVKNQYQWNQNQACAICSFSGK